MALGGGTETRRPRNSDYGSDSGDENESGFEILLLIEPIGFVDDGDEEKKDQGDSGFGFAQLNGRGNHLLRGECVCVRMCIHTMHFL